MDAQQFKNVMSRWASGISVITTQHEGDMQGFTANSLASVSIDPMLVSMSVTNSLSAGQLISQSGYFVVNILTEDQLEYGKIFAGMTAKEDRFEGIDITTTTGGCPILPNLMGWLSCRVYKQIDVGASNLILGEVIDAAFTDADLKPLLYFHRQWGQFTPYTD